MKSLKFDNVYEDFKGKKRLLYTKSLAPEKKVYGEQLVNVDGIEYREWNFTRSKLGAAIMKGISQIGFRKGETVLYLGSASGTTVSHVSDIIEDGMIFALDFAPRSLRDLVFLCDDRSNIAPILADANQPLKYSGKISQVDFVFQDVAQRNQVEIFLKNVDMFLKPGGFCMLSVKSRSIDVSKKPAQVFKTVGMELEKHLKVIDYRELDPFERDHAVFLCKR
jgi:fibrillarin-like pre-rRNA processing protein